MAAHEVFQIPHLCFCFSLQLHSHFPIIDPPALCLPLTPIICLPRVASLASSLCSKPSVHFCASQQSADTLSISHIQVPKRENLTGPEHRLACTGCWAQSLHFKSQIIPTCRSEVPISSLISRSWRKRAWGAKNDSLIAASSLGRTELATGGRKQYSGQS